VKKLYSVVLLCAFAGLASFNTAAQIATSGPAALTRQMPRIYAPHMANQSRIKYHQRHKNKHKQKQKRVSSHSTSHTH
jgi:hypothetical protein